jgi:hypothetical protein
MSRQIAWIRLDEDPATAADEALGGRRMTTEPINAAEARKLSTSMA